MTIPTILCLYLIIINVLTFIAFGIDKFKAVAHLWRISEKILLLLALVGGVIGGWLAMFLFRHKIKDNSFLPWIIAITIFWLIVICLLLP